MKDTIKVIIKRPDEKYGHVTQIKNTLERLQNTVNGYIETIPVTSDSVIICNENGKIDRLQRNFKFGKEFFDIICGTVIVCGTDGEDFCDVPFDFQFWKKLLMDWGNT